MLHTACAGMQKAFRPDVRSGRKADDSASAVPPALAVFTARSLTETARPAGAAISLRYIGRTRPRLLNRLCRSFRRMLRAVLPPNESAALPPSAALLKIRGWRYSSPHCLARIIPACRRFVKRDTAKKPRAPHTAGRSAYALTLWVVNDTIFA